jgi:hypothetical protein
MMRYAGILLRLLVLALVWLAVAVVIHFGWIGTGMGSSIVYRPGNEGAFAFIAAFSVISGLVLSERVLGLRVRLGFRDEAPAPRKAVIEPEALRLRDMISLLDEDDLDDLRAEVREGLRDRIRNLTADESESFEDLLADSGTKRKRGTR